MVVGYTNRPAAGWTYRPSVLFSVYKHTGLIFRAVGGGPFATHHNLVVTTRSTCQDAQSPGPPLPVVHEITPPAGSDVETPCEPTMPRLIVWAWSLVSVQDTVRSQLLPGFVAAKSRVTEALLRLA
jgi:hypothetical protein